MSVLFRLKPVGNFKETFHIEAFKKAQEIALDDLAQEALEQFQKTVATWDNPPNFTVRKNKDNRSITTAGKAGEIYGYVDNGTPAHMIYPRQTGGVLVFGSKFRPKTRPGVVSSSPGYSGGDTVFTRAVHHPGSQARGFSEIIQARQARRFPIRFRQVFDELLHT